MVKHKPEPKQVTNANKSPVQRPNLWDRIRSWRFRFAAGFVLSCIGLYTLIQALPQSVTGPINTHTARTLGLVLNAVGIPAVSSCDVVSEEGLAFQIIPECTPIFTAGLFISFVTFHPSSVRQKAAGLAWGIPALYLGNLLRLAAAFAISRHDGRLFEVIHVYLGQVFTLFLVILCCVLWMRWVERGEAKQNWTMPIAARFLARFGLISAVLFVVWLNIHHGYIRLLDRLTAFGFSLIGRSAGLEHQTLVYYETFSIVVVVALVFSASPIPWRRRIPLLSAGLGILLLIHLLHRIDNAVMANFGVTALQNVDLTALVVGQYLVPVAILISVARLQWQEIRSVPASGTNQRRGLP